MAVASQEKTKSKILIGKSPVFYGLGAFAMGKSRHPFHSLLKRVAPAVMSAKWWTSGATSISSPGFPLKMKRAQVEVSFHVRQMTYIQRNIHFVIVVFKKM
jgi:hypothetical protein